MLLRIMQLQMYSLHLQCFGHVCKFVVKLLGQDIYRLHAIAVILCIGLNLKVFSWSYIFISRSWKKSLDKKHWFAHILMQTRQLGDLARRFFRHELPHLSSCQASIRYWSSWSKGKINISSGMKIHQTLHLNTNWESECTGLICYMYRPTEIAVVLLWDLKVLQFMFYQLKWRRNEQTLVLQWRRRIQ